MLIAPPRRACRGSTLLEVLVTLGILAFGLLGLAGLQSKIQQVNVESYQRAQASILLSDMVERMNVAPAIDGASVSCYALALEADREACLARRVDGYVSSTPLGTGDDWYGFCPTAPGPARDQCEWSRALKGSAEWQSSQRVGAMIGARGCIERVQAPDPTPAVCTPGVYLVSVTWQGLHKTVAPQNACAADLYGDDAFRRVVSSRVVVGQPGCV